MDATSSGENIIEELGNTDYTFDELFEENVFHVPRYQRFYSWERSEWADLWNDLSNMAKNDREHYMGTVICKEEPTPILTEEGTNQYRNYAIVDGQQRFTTLIILIKAIASVYTTISSEEAPEEGSGKHTEESVKLSRKRFLKDWKIRLANRESRCKLRLQDDDNNTLEGILEEDIDETATETPSQDRLIQAYRFYREELKERQEELSHGQFISHLDELLSAIRSLNFIVYTVDNSEQATLIFESINDRGIGLSNLDKTKSFLMHKVYLTQGENPHSGVSVNGVQKRFGRIYRWMQDILETDRVSDIGEDQIQRYHYISTINTTVNSSYLRQETNRRNKTLRSGATVYLGALKWHFTNLHEENDLSIYNSYPRDCPDEIDSYTKILRRYYSHMETIGSYGQDGEYNPDIDWELRKIFALDRLGNFYPILLAIWDEYDSDSISEDELYEMLQLIEVASFRIYTTVSRSDTGRNRFYSVANDIGTGDKDAAWIIEELKDCIRSKENDFEGTLRNQNAYNSLRYKDLRYLLYSYEIYRRDEAKGGDVSSIEKAAENAGNEYTLDHIWPNDTQKLDLSEEEEEVHEEVKHSLGNLTLTTGPRNSGWKNLPYPKKRSRMDDDEENDSDYLNSDFTITREIARENKEWGEGQIAEQLDDIVDFAKRRWSLETAERQPLSEIRPATPD
ncbi:DUF262 domain-containing protein [Natronoarchaeum rubrum]|uniref:DUF262 domain-containing protein n=1 Tax=Natronoarchaeum rubrum TaxID=755311 RepID=UPI0021127C59|nr:DUF262 domain-containing protein [Natronoarchaeum rubrum]